ncbi:MAG: hypothetical protein HY582_00530, partial [Candidatus Omnitrophica bacterium]|nr:hypothetical protein [Candidatus Omnitrophota bacterium]
MACNFLGKIVGSDEFPTTLATVNKITNRAFLLLIVNALLFAISHFLYAQPEHQKSAQILPNEPEINFLLRDQFFLSPEAKFKFNTYETNGFLLVKEPRVDLNSDYALISGFDGSVLETRSLKDIKTVDQATELLKESIKTTYFMDVAIKEATVPLKDGTAITRYWVGNQSFSSLEVAKASIVSTKTAIEGNGGDFKRAIDLIDEFAPAEPKAETLQEAKARFEREEDFAIKVMDWLDVGEKLYGPFHTRDSPWGERILWQSFGESSFRFTNLERDEYLAQVGYWTNRLVLKGIWGPW